MTVIRVLGVPEVDAALAAALGPEMEAKTALGLKAWGAVIQAAARDNLRPHHWHGTAEQQTSVAEPIATPLGMSVTVGIHGGLAPEGRPLESGWASLSGKQPPTDAIAAWLTSKPELAGTPSVSRVGGFVRRTGTIAAISQESAIRSRAFLIARKIGRSGYSFPPLHWLEKAATETLPAGLAAFRERIAL